MSDTFGARDVGPGPTGSWHSFQVTGLVILRHVDPGTDVEYDAARRDTEGESLFDVQGSFEQPVPESLKVGVVGPSFPRHWWAQYTRGLPADPVFRPSTAVIAVREAVGVDGEAVLVHQAAEGVGVEVLTGREGDEEVLQTILPGGLPGQIDDVQDLLFGGHGTVGRGTVVSILVDTIRDLADLSCGGAGVPTAVEVEQELGDDFVRHGVPFSRLR